ncbi:transposable element-related [Anaeramoeba flamelloides]|uniref:Transposable element-related n=1 Tax=Anaeramoeba flamelloides TaxID=1746091 RepID=A0ABQ8XR69_9EUKA|nr:transposable element-related [Anaeramoeba flamelloides]
MHNQGKSIREISRELKIGTKKVRVWIKNWNSEGRLCNKKRGRKRKKMCNQLKYFIEQETKLHRSSVFIEKKKFEKKIMIWGAIAHDVQTDLIIINGTVNTECYIHDIIKKSNVIQLANSEYGEFKWIFQQDGARPHTSKKTLTYLKQRCNVLDPCPPNSPDLNPIENLWSIMDTKLKNCNPKNEEEFIKIITNVWDTLSWKTLENLVISMYKRIDLVIEREGESINSFY